MKRKSHLIVPIYIPHQGCPYRCVFCNQNEISGTQRKSDKDLIEATLKTYFESQRKEQLPLFRQAAFYGGSFTGLSLERQTYLLETLQPWIKQDWVQSLRVSTHPLLIADNRLNLLAKYNVKTVELGIQSTSENVLRLSGRECPRENVDRAVELIRRKNFQLGLQLMLGLPGDNEKTFLESVENVIHWRPDFVRIYPALVIRNTRLHDMFRKKQYMPWTLERAVEALKKAVLKFQSQNIPIIRLGLHPEPSLIENFVAGPYHPSLRYLVDCEIALDEMVSRLKSLKKVPGCITFKVPGNRLSVYKGHRLKNVRYLKERFFLNEVVFQPNDRTQGIEIAA